MTRPVPVNGETPPAAAITEPPVTANRRGRCQAVKAEPRVIGSHSASAASLRQNARAVNAELPPPVPGP